MPTNLSIYLNHLFRDLEDQSTALDEIQLGKREREMEMENDGSRNLFLVWKKLLHPVFV